MTYFKGRVREHEARNADASRELGKARLEILL